MKNYFWLLVLLWSPNLWADTAKDCLTLENLTSLDARYEEALRLGDVQWLDNLLSDNFLWVHNLASAKETKAILFERLRTQTEVPKARRSEELRLERLANTGVLIGLSQVEKWNADGKTWRAMTYQFMRTYVQDAQDQGRCKLLAVQTMKIWSSDGL